MAKREFAGSRHRSARLTRQTSYPILDWFAFAIAAAFIIAVTIAGQQTRSDTAGGMLTAASIAIEK